MTTGTIVMKIIIDAVLLLLSIVFIKLGFKDQDKWPTMVWILFFLTVAIGIWFL